MNSDGGRNVLVAGATGYVGTRLVGELLDAGHTVTAMGRSLGRLAGRTWSEHPRVKLVAADYVPNAFDTALQNAAEAAVRLTGDWKLLPGRTFTLPQYTARQKNLDQFIYSSNNSSTVFNGPDMRNIQDHEFNMVVAQPGDKKDVIITGDLRDLDSYPDEVANAVRSALEFAKALDK